MINGQLKHQQKTRYVPCVMVNKKVGKAASRLLELKSTSKTLVEARTLAMIIFDQLLGESTGGSGWLPASMRSNNELVFLASVARMVLKLTNEVNSSTVPGSCSRFTACGVRVFSDK